MVEWLPWSCGICKKFGHIRANCPLKPAVYKPVYKPKGEKQWQEKKRVYQTVNSGKADEKSSAGIAEAREEVDQSKAVNEEVGTNCNETQCTTIVVSSAEEKNGISVASAGAAETDQGMWTEVKKKKLKKEVGKEKQVERKMTRAASKELIVGHDFQVGKGTDSIYYECSESSDDNKDTPEQKESVVTGPSSLQNHAND